MWPLGHVAIGYLCYSLSTRTRLDAPPEPAAIAAVVLGSVVPDLIDKPLAWYLGVLPTGRSFAHSLVLLVPLCLLLYFLLEERGRGELAVAFAIGAIAHALTDALPALWRPDTSVEFLLFPLMPVEAYENGAPAVIPMLLDQLASPWFHLEFVLAALALWLWVKDGRPGYTPRE